MLFAFSESPPSALSQSSPESSAPTRSGTCWSNDCLAWEIDSFRVFEMSVDERSPVVAEDPLAVAVVDMSVVFVGKGLMEEIGSGSVGRLRDYVPWSHFENRFFGYALSPWPAMLENH